MNGRSKCFVNLAFMAFIFEMNSELVNTQKSNDLSQYNGQNLSDFEDFARLGTFLDTSGIGKVVLQYELECGLCNCNFLQKSLGKMGNQTFQRLA